MLTPGLFLFTGLIITLALISCVLLLIFDLLQPFLHRLVHAPLSAAPLLLIGLASLSFQLVIRPKPLQLLKAFIVSSAFILWGVVQLLPAGWVATMLGDVVIVLYVIDLGWMMLDRLTHQGWLRQAPPAIWKGSEAGKAATSAPFPLSAPGPQPLRSSSTVFWAQNTPPMRPMHLRVFQDPSSEDTSSHHGCSGHDRQGGNSCS